ncbi:Hypothetical predicted protein [Octopus vulgaris]|uniref:Uncharacterized protein n=1 Tax=Octopus vulgaris TaxID=6645 RepID=A0AA36B1V3_OCTVU|nr:Hypothetical predicted protein [Octopus vulgaris]
MFEENSTKLVRMSGVQVANSHSKRVTIGDRSGVISKTDSHSKYQKRIFHKTFLSRIVLSKRGETFKQREVKENFEQSRRHHKSNELTNHFPSNDRKNQHIHLPTNFKKFFVNTFTRQASSTQHAHIFDKRVLEPEYSLSSNPKLKTTTVSKNKPNQSNAREIAMVKAFWNRDDDGIHGIAGPTVEFKRNVFQKPMKIQENLVKPIEVERISNKDLEKHVKSKFNLLFDNQKGNMDVLNQRDVASKYSLASTKNHRIRKTSASNERLDQMKRVFSNRNIYDTSFINRAVTSVNGIVQEIVILKTDYFRQPTVLLVKIEYLQREVNFYCNQSKTVFTFNRLIFPLPYLHIGNDKKFQASNRIGLPVLLSLNLKEYERTTGTGGFRFLLPWLPYPSLLGHSPG